MSDYEYFMVSLSILIGLAIGILVTRGVTLLGARDEVVFHWVPALWALGILAWIVQYCYVGWQVNDFKDWRFSIYLLMLIELIALYGAAELILPSGESGARDLLANFEQRGSIALQLFFVYFVLAIATNVLVLDEIDIAKGALTRGEPNPASYLMPAPGIVLIAWGSATCSNASRAAPAFLFGVYTVLVYFGMLAL